MTDRNRTANRLTSKHAEQRNLREQFLDAVSTVRLKSGSTPVELLQEKVSPMFGSVYDGAVKSLAAHDPSLRVDEADSPARMFFDSYWSFAGFSVGLGGGRPESPWDTYLGDVVRVRSSWRRFVALREVVARELALLNLDGYEGQDGNIANVAWTCRAVWHSLMVWHVRGREQPEVLRQFHRPPALVSTAGHEVFWSLPPKSLVPPQNPAKSQPSEYRVWVRIPLDLLYVDPDTDRTDLQKRVLAWHANLVSKVATLGVGKGGVVRAVKKRGLRHFAWAARFQVGREGMPSIAWEQGVKVSAVSQALHSLATAIDLPLRKHNPGGTLSKGKRR